MESIILFKGQSQYGALNHWVDDLATTFQSLGFETITIDLLQEDHKQRLAEIWQLKNIKFFLGINGWGMNWGVQEQSAYDYLQVPFLGWFIDHPCYHFSRLNPISSREMVLAFVDQTHLQFVSPYLPSSIVKGFIPHAAQPVTHPLKPFQERELDFVFLGSFADLTQIKTEIDALPASLKQVVWETIAAAKFNQQDPLNQLLSCHFTEKGLNPEEIAPDLWYLLLRKIELYIRYFRRNHILSTIKKTPLWVFSNAGKHFQNVSNNIRFMDPIPYTQTLQILGNTKLALNISPYILAGGHDRLFNSMLQGAACFTDTNGWLQDNFQDNQSLYFYDLNSSILDDKLQMILSQPDHMAALAERGREIAQQSHTWLQRAQTMLDLIETHQRSKTQVDRGVL